ncbi:MAG: hypothetical protein DRN66_03140 [Candidatus Nanohalarchaeota archaeon]|nr:MAG: hypothetical protein DRN66_03140 [Candidatus Nanohaloarchaeota archaeon]
MMSLKKLIDKYSSFVSKNTYFIIFMVLIITVFAFFEAQTMQTKSMDYKDMLPDDIEVIQTMDLIKNQFGGTDSVMIVIEIDPEYKGSNEIRDIREPEVIRYIYLLGESARHIDDVTGVSSSAEILKNMNNDHLPKTKNKVIDLSKDSALIGRYISEDYALSTIRINLREDFDEDQILVDLTDLINEIPKPSSLKVSLAGQDIAMPIIKEQLKPDMKKTSTFSLIGIIIVLLLLFRSVKHGLIPLATIGIGILWTFGFIAFIGMGINSATSGVISMIMGIGIDFGIQTITRFRQELTRYNKHQAMAITLDAVFMPMATTTLAALIGFKAMSLGELTMMGEMGTIMSYGIAACFLAAITFLPAILIITQKGE